MSLEDDATAVSPEPGEGSADAAADGKTDVESTTTTPKLSKNQLKKLAKGQGGEKKKVKEKPTWNQPGEGKKAKAKDDKKSSALSALSQKSVFVNVTPKGSKKDLSKSPMADAYHPEAVEAAWQDWWEASGYYSCDPASAVGRTADEKFVMVIPPPNVTGSLHLGHALTAAVEDTLTRWHRMLGHATLYVPGESLCLISCVEENYASGISANPLVC
jgi:valyl-tRNA synthetase